MVWLGCPAVDPPPSLPGPQQTIATKAAALPALTGRRGLEPASLFQARLDRRPWLVIWLAVPLPLPTGQESRQTRTHATGADRRAGENLLAAQLQLCRCYILCSTADNSSLQLQPARTIVSSPDETSTFPAKRALGLRHTTGSGWVYDRYSPLFIVFALLTQAGSPRTAHMQ